MGYIRRDFSAPTIAKWQYSLKFKNTILRHWPTTMVGPTGAQVKVFAPLFIYQNGIGILKTPSHLKIYKLLGMKVAELEKGPYDGIENTYMYVPGIDLNYDILQTQIQSYVELNSPLIYPLSKDPFNPDPLADTRLNPDEYRDNPEWTYGISGDAIDAFQPEPKWDKDGWITTYLTYSPPVKADVPETIGDAAILALIEAGDRTNIHFDDAEDHPLTFASILDTGNILFENKVRIVQKTIEERTTHTYTLNRGNLSSNGTAVGRYLKTAVIEYKFRRVKDASDPLVAALITKIETEMEALSVKLNQVVSPRLRNLIRQSNTFGASLESSVSKQLIRMYHDRVGYAAGTLNYNGHLMYDAMATQKAKDFGKIFSKQIKQGHTLKKVKWYKKALVIVIDIIVIVVAIIVFILTGGNMAAVSAVFSIGAMVQMALAYYWAKNGDPAAANYAMGHAEWLGYAALAFGVINIMQNAYQKLAEEAIKEAAKEAVKEGVKQAAMKTVEDITFQQVVEYVVSYIKDISLDTIKELVLGLVPDTSHMTTGQLLNMGVQYLNQGFSIYQQYIDPSQDKLEDKRSELEASNKELEDTAGPETLDTIEVEYSDPYNNWIDMNEKMQILPYMMTAGKNKLLMNKYYNSRY